MLSFKNALTLTFLGLLLSSQVKAIEEKFFDVTGLDSKAVVLEKIGAPKDSLLPTIVKKKDMEIKLEVLPDKVISLDFTPSHSFTISDKDLFEKIETPGPKDVFNQELVVADPKTGRIFHLTLELKVSKLDLVQPWATKIKLKPLKVILDEMHTGKIEKKK